MEVGNLTTVANQSAQQLSPIQALNDEALEAATRGFEAIFLRQFLSQSLQPLLHDTPGSQTAGSGIYQSMVSEVLANNLAATEKFGFSSMLQMQLRAKPVEAII